MATLNITTRAGENMRLEGREGLSVMEIIRDSGSDELLALCGGCCSCATCHVYVEEPFVDRLPAIGSDEDELLNCSSHRQTNSRLSCQIPFSDALDGLRVTIALAD